MKPKSFRFWFVLVYVFFLGNCYAQDPTHRIFTTENGLPSNEVYKIIEDQKGYLWMATDRGVVRYNGYEFKIFTTDDGLTNNVVFWIHEDGFGRIWFVCQDRSICFYQDGNFIGHPANAELKEDYFKIIYSIYVEPNGVVWLGGKSKDPVVKLYPDGKIEKLNIQNSIEPLSVIVQLGEKNLVYGLTTSQRTVPDMDQTIVYDSTGEVICNIDLIEGVRNNLSAILTENRLYISNNNHIYQLEDSLNYIEIPGEGKFTLSLYEDLQKNIWAGKFKQGAFRFSGDNLKAPPLNIFKGKSITSICQDREGGFWLSTIGNGVFYCPSINASMIQSDQISKTINGIVVIDSSAWINTAEGKVYEIKKESDGFSTKFILEDEKLNRDLYKDVQNRIWIKTVQNHSLDEKVIVNYDYSQQGMVQEDDSLFWIASQNGLKKIKMPEWSVLVDLNLEIDRVNDLELLGKDSLLIASNNGLWVYGSKEISRFPFQHPASENRVNHLQKLRDVTIVISSMGHGLIRLHPNGTFEQVRKSDGILTDLVNCSYTLPGDSITWVGSSMGMSKVEWRKNLPPKILNFTIYNGLSSNEIRDMDFGLGKLWVATGKGITIIDPYNFTPPFKEPLIHLKEILINDVRKNSYDNLSFTMQRFSYSV